MRRSSLWLKGIGLLLGLGLLGWIINDAIEQSRSVTWPPIPVTSVALAFLIVLVARGLVAFAWVAGAQSIAPRMEWDVGVATYSVAFLARYIPGKIWQVGGLVYLARHRGANAIDIGVFSVIFLVTHQLIGGAMALLAMATQDLHSSWIIVIFGTGALLLSAALIWLSFGNHIVDNLPARFAKYAQGVFKQSMQTSIYIAALLVATWALLATSGFILIGGFQPDWDGNWAHSATVILGGVMVGFLVFIAPSGVGVREGTMLVLLESIGVGSLSAFMIVVSHRLIMVAAELVWGSIGVITLAVRPVLVESE